MVVAGWPNRVGRNTWGPTMRDEKRQIDPSNSLNHDQMNLWWWQQGGLGLSAPKATMFWTPPGEGGLKLKVGLFSWDQTIYEDVAVGSLPAYILSYVVNGVGDYTLTFDNEVLGRPDGDGVQQLEPLSFASAVADVNLFAGGARGFVNVTLLTPQSLQIEITRAGFSSDQPYALSVY